MSATTSPPLNPSAAVVWADSQRAQAFRAWLDTLVPTHGLRPATVRPASADASFRRYLRVDTQAGTSRIIMDAPPDKEDCRPFVQVQALLHAAGLCVPEILDWDAEHGFMLLSDVGTQTLIDILDADRPEDAQAWTCTVCPTVPVVTTIAFRAICRRLWLLKPFSTCWLLAYTIASEVTSRR